jgi:lysophospholipase L1-like esterase
LSSRVVRQRRLSAGGVLVAAALAISCSSPTQPTPPPTLTVACPASVAAQSPDGNAVIVTFTAPQPSGGTAPVTSTCSSQSGWTYPVGSTPVTCTATDAKQQTASCGFQVNVTAPPQLSATKFVAFGDSITLGVESTCENSLIGGVPRLTWFEEMQLLRTARVVDNPYPKVLQEMLARRYTAQDLAVVNEGKGGECPTGCPINGVDRLPDVLSRRMPQWLLLQEGVNNINLDLPSSITNVINGLKMMIRQAKAQGVPVMVGTLLPERPISEGGCRGRGPELIAPANDQIRALVQSEGEVLVDLYEAFGGAPGTFIGVDGLHPTDEGYAKIAATFFEEIKKRLEAAPPMVRPQTARPSLPSRPGAVRK